MESQTQVLDASGRLPAPLTAFERKIAAATSEGVMVQRHAELADKQALPLSEKISLSLRLIRDWYEAWDGMVSVSYSGGKDSTVLLWLVRSMYPDVPAVFSHTGLEYPEVVRQVLATPNHVILRPKMHFSRVIKEYGWPLASKKIARGVELIRHPTENNANVRRLYLEGINRYGRPVNGFKIAQRWRFLFDAPFECSDRCCGIMKKDPAARYERETGRKPFVGTMASDSKSRQRTYLLNGGCNAFDMKHPRSAPLSFWTEQDILRCVRENDIAIPAVYGDIVGEHVQCQLPGIGNEQYAKLHTTGVRRTGCVFCCFGLHLDEGEYNRFEMLAMTHPKMHSYVMDKLGLRAVLEYCKENSAPVLAKTFRWEKPEAN